MLYNGRWYYLYDRKNASRGWHKINGNWYFFSMGNAWMVTGWMKWIDKWYYLYPNGVMAIGRHYIDGKYYTFSTTGAWIA